MLRSVLTGKYVFRLFSICGHKNALLVVVAHFDQKNCKLNPKSALCCCGSTGAEWLIQSSESMTFVAFVTKVQNFSNLQAYFDHDMQALFLKAVVKLVQIALDELNY